MKIKGLHRVKGPIVPITDEHGAVTGTVLIENCNHNISKLFVQKTAALGTPRILHTNHQLSGLMYA